MRQTRIVFVVSTLLLVSLACNAVNGLRMAQTEIPAMITAAPTVLGPLGTAAAEFTPPANVTDMPGTAAANSTSGLGIALADVKSVMESTKQFSFADGIVDGQQATIASLSPSVSENMPGLADSFSAAFIGDPANLGEIKIKVPYSEDQAAITTGVSMLTVLFAGILPPTALISFIPWINDKYAKLPAGGSEELVSGKLKFTLSRTETIIMLDLVPVK